MTPRTGRPIKGNIPLRDMERVSIRLRPSTKRELFALADRLGIAVYEVVERAVLELAARTKGRKPS